MLLCVGYRYCCLASRLPNEAMSVAAKRNGVSVAPSKPHCNLHHV